MALSKADKARLHAQADEIDALKQKLETAERNANYSRERASTLEREVNDLHDLLDTLGAVKRRAEGAYTDRPAMTRLASFLAGRRAGPACPTEGGAW